jgi:hypothetical protein
MYKNKTKLGCEKGTVQIKGDLTEPIIGSLCGKGTETIQIEGEARGADDQEGASK